MPCRKCGAYEIVTTDGLCLVCSDVSAHQVTVPTFFGQPIVVTTTGDTGVVKESVSALERMPWDDYFLAICDVVKLRSIDKDTQNGSVIVNAQHRVVSTGYNAFPAGVDDTFWPCSRNEKQYVPHVGVGRPEHGYIHDLQPRPAKHLDSKYIEAGQFYTVDKYMPMTHAEMNAVVSAGQDLHGCCIYTLLFPCHECAKAIITSGIRRVVYRVTREDVMQAVAKELFIQAGVTLVGPEKP